MSLRLTLKRFQSVAEHLRNSYNFLVKSPYHQLRSSAFYDWLAEKTAERAVNKVIAFHLDQHLFEDMKYASDGTLTATAEYITNILASDLLFRTGKKRDEYEAFIEAILAVALSIVAVQSPTLFAFALELTPESDPTPPKPVSLGDLLKELPDDGS